MLTHHGDVHVLDLGDGENRIDPAMLSGLEEALSAVAEAPPPRALVTMGSGRFYSNGFDLDLITTYTTDELVEFASRFERFLAALVTAPFITVAAITGHCYAAGALLTLAHDYRLMRNDRGWFCLPSVDVGIPFTRAMTELITAKVPAPTAHSLVVSGDRMGGAACEGYGVVHDALGHDQVVPSSIELAARLAGKDPTTLGTIKQRLYAAILDHVR